MILMELADINNNNNPQNSKIQKNIHIITEQLMATSLFIDSNSVLPAHSHDCHDEILYVVSGSGEITIEDDKKPIHEGMLIFVPQAKSHHIRTLSEQLFLLTFSKIDNHHN